MGVLTCEEIIKQGVRLAGVTYDATDTKQLAWLKQWLRSVALSWPWPEVKVITTVTLPANQYTLDVGGGAAILTTTYIQRLDFPVYINYGETYLPAQIEQQAIMDINVTPPKGVPDKVSYSISSVNPGRITLIFNRKPIAALVLQVAFQVDPAVGYVLANMPWYLNDNTLIQAIAYKQSEDSNGVTAEDTLKLRDDLAMMLRDDKLKFGIIDQLTTKVNRRPSFT